MKLKCHVEIQSRLLATNNIKARNKPQAATLAIGCNDIANKDKAWILLCTAQNKSGMKFKVYSNIENIFQKFVDEGKATIRLEEPPQDVILSKADSSQLKIFLQILKLSSKGQFKGMKGLPSLNSVKSKQVDPPKKRLRISSRKDYPVTSSFSAELIELYVNGCSLKRFDNRFSKIHALSMLDLSNNCIEKIPENFCLNLKELNLSNNSLIGFPESICKKKSLPSLLVLRLDNNKINILPPSFHLLNSLEILNVSQNKLVRLPHQIGRLRRLRKLHASDNLITSLPASLLLLQLETIDVFNNPFQHHEIFKDLIHLPSLTDLAGLCLLKNKISFNELDMPKHLSDMLVSAHRCLCWRLCFKSHIFTVTPISLKRCANTVTSLDSTGSYAAPFELFLCSKTCFKRFKRCDWLF